MHSTRRLVWALAVSWVATSCLGARTGLAQVSPAEITNPQLKAAEKAYLPQLVSLNRAIAGLKFPFSFVLSRYVGLDPRQQRETDTRGLEFVSFHDRLVLKVTGNYNAAYNPDLLTANQRADHVLGEVALPILRLILDYFSRDASFDAFGFEISYHVRRQTPNYDYEGKEVLVLVFDRADAFSYLDARRESERQEILNRSEIYLDGKEFGLALGQRGPLNLDELERPRRNPPLRASETGSAPGVSNSADRRLTRLDQDLPVGFHKPEPQTPANTSRSEARAALTEAPRTRADADALLTKVQAQLQVLDKEGRQRYHFVDYAPPSFGIFRNQIYLQLTLRNPMLFDVNTSSIYKRAAQSFDLFLAPLLKPLLENIPSDPALSGLDVTVLTAFSPKATSSSEAVEYLCPLQPLRKFAEAEITNQELIDQSVILVNGVRIALNLQQVE